MNSGGGFATAQPIGTFLSSIIMLRAAMEIKASNLLMDMTGDNYTDLVTWKMTMAITIPGLMVHRNTGRYL
jgi:hypothetical protein